MGQLDAFCWVRRHCYQWLVASFVASVPVSVSAFSAKATVQGHVDKWLTHTQGDGSQLPDKVLGNEVFYQAFVDRFANGNVHNDCFYDRRFCDPLQHNWYRYWGGDLRGLINHMGYLKALGITRLWLTPIFENQMVVTQRHKFGRSIEMTSYHGYWFRDWFQLNPVFTDDGKRDFAIVDEMIEVAGPEIRILLDSVANHTSPSDPTPSSLAFLDAIEPLDQSDGLKRTHRGALFRAGQYVTSMDEDAHGRHGREKHFHHYGFITDYNNLFQLENYQLDGLSDIDQNSHLMSSYLREAHRFWLDRFPQLAGYRMDTIKHVPHGYWRAFDKDMYASYPDLEIVGEYYSAGPYNPDSHTYYRDTQMSMFDFDFRSAIQNVFLYNRSMSEFTRLWERDGSLLDARPMVTFIDNHDMPRLRGQGLSYQAMKQATALLFTARGIPCIFYGQEQDLFYPNDPGDPYNRPMMRNFDQKHELFQMTATLSRLRKANLALRYGKTHVVHETDHVFAYERVYGDERVFFATSKNPIAGTDDFEMQNLSLPDGRYRDVLTDQVYHVRGGRMPVSLRQGDIIVLSSTHR